MKMESIAALWTFVEIHQDAEYSRPPEKRRPIRSDTIDAWRRIADVVASEIATLDTALGVDELFDEAVWRLSGSRLDDLRKNQMRLVDESSFERDRIAPLRRTLGLDDLRQQEDHARVRVLLLHAAESRFVPYAEGAVAAMVHAPSRDRWDVRTAFHTVTRWASTHHPVLAMLAARSLVVRDEARPWPPITKFYEQALTRHIIDEDDRWAAAAELSRSTIEALDAGGRVHAERGETLRSLMTRAEAVGVLPPRPRFEPDESARRESELTRLLLDLELGRLLSGGTLLLLQLIRDETEARHASA